MIATLLADPGPQEPGGARSSVRISRPPSFEPPFDDECHQVPARPARLANSLGVPPPRDPATRLAAPSATVPQQPVPGDSGSTRAAMRYVRLCIEILNGFRPAAHLRSIGGPAEFGDVLAQLRYRRNGRGHFRNSEGISGQLAGNASARGRTGRAASSRTFGPSRPQGAGVPANLHPTTSASQAAITGSAQRRPTDVRTPGPRGPVSPVPPHDRNTASANAPFGLQRLRVSEPLDGIAEVVAVLSQAGASIAMALRLERRSAEWVCTVVQVV